MKRTYVVEVEVAIEARDETAMQEMLRRLRTRDAPHINLSGASVDCGGYSMRSTRVVSVQPKRGGSR